jgi:phospholipid-binding lipoprotein MlaA
VTMFAHLRPRVLAAAIALATLAACATGPNANPRDPLEPVNREIYRINEDLDAGVIKPIAQLYSDYVPSPVQTAVGNVFSNFSDMYSVVNNLLQAKPGRAAEDTMRVAINTVFGLGGLIDIATPAGLPKYKEDFGQTLGYWGLPSGPYIVLPLLGPSSVRDTVGIAVDMQFEPVAYFKSDALKYSTVGLFVIDKRSRLLGATSLLEAAALDKYSFMRDSYLQRRNYLVHDGNPPLPANTPSEAAAPPAGGSTPKQ